jgi:hypothetical protein
MNLQIANLPQPRSRLWGTRLKWPRDVRRFAPRLDAAELLQELPDSAEAAHWGQVSLLEDLVVALHRDGTATWLTHAIIAPHGNEFLAEWDQIARLYDRSASAYRVGIARIHLPDGTSRPAVKKVQRFGLKNRALNLTFAPLRPGVVVEMEMQRDSFVPDDIGPAVWENFLLQSLWPCRRRRITIAISEPFAARIELFHGASPAEESRASTYRVYVWDVRDVPGIEADAFTPSPRDFAPWIDFTTLPDWRTVGEHYRQELALAHAAKSSIRSLALKLTAEAKTDRERALAIYRYAARDMRYGRHPSEFDVATIRDPAQMLEDLRGDCKDKSSLMVAMFAELNIPARVAVLLTAMNGRAPLLPGRRFDHAIVAATIDGQELWFDPAAAYFTFGRIPQNDQGVTALLLDHKEQSLVEIPLDSPEGQCVTRLCRGSLTAAGDYDFQAEIDATGERAAQFRGVLTDRNEDHQRRIIEQAVAEERPGAIVSDITISNLEDLERDVHYSYRLSLPAWARPIQDLLLFRLPLAEPLEVTGPISARERRLPLQMPGPMQIVERHEIALPAGFTAYALPRDIRHASPWADYSLHIGVEAGHLICERSMQSRGGIVPAERFTELKAFWENCARADAMDIVLVRGVLTESKEPSFS